jgi:hypothetical protein
VLGVQWTVGEVLVLELGADHGGDDVRAQDEGQPLVGGHHT